MKRLGIGVGLKVGSAGGINWSSYWTQQYQDVLDYMTAQSIELPTNDDKLYQAQWVKAMVDGGYWAKCEIIDMLSTPTGQQLINWKNPGTYNPAELGTPVFAEYKGYKGDNTTTPKSQIDTQFIPLSNAVMATASSQALLFGVGSNVNEGAVDAGTQDSGRWLAVRTNSGSAMSVYINATVYSFNHSGAIGHYAISRNNATDFNIHKNHFYYIKTLAAAAGRPSKKLYINGYGTGTAATKEIRYLIYASGLTPQEVDSIITITEAYLSNYSTNLYTGVSGEHSLLERISDKTLFKGDDALPWIGRPYLTVAANGNWIMVHKSSLTHNANDDSAIITMRVSDDQGATWSDANKLPNGTAITNAPFTKQDPTSLNRGAGMLMTCPNDDLILSVWEDGGDNVGPYQWRSTDNGATWTAEGNKLGETYLAVDDKTIVGSVVYMLARDYPVDSALMLYKSEDNCLTWSKVSDIQTAVTSEEAGVEYLGDGVFIVVMKSSTTNTYKYVSLDNGLTWTRTDIMSAVGNIQKPVLNLFNGLLYLTARQYYGTTSDHRTVVYVSADSGATWSEAFFPEAYAYFDCGYTNMLQRTNGDLYLASYKGLYQATDIVEYLFKAK